jgi:hypothetical protein
MSHYYLYNGYRFFVSRDLLSLPALGPRCRCRCGVRGTARTAAVTLSPELKGRLAEPAPVQ